MKKKLGIAVLVVLLCWSAATAWGVIPPTKFPMWKQAEELPLAGNGYGTDWLGLGWQKQEVAGNLAWDQIAWEVGADDPRYPYGGTFIIDYSKGLDQAAGKRGQPSDYHTIYQGNLPPITKNNELILRMPAGTFCALGEYRVRLVNRENEVAAMENVWIVSGGNILPRVKGKEFNDFPRWEWLGGTVDRVNEDITMTFTAIKRREPEWPEEYVAALEYELVNQRDSYSCCPDCWRIDYLCDGEWYKVASNREDRLIAMSEQTVPGLTYVKQYPLECKEVLEHPGTYRLYRDGVGYCEFQVE